MTDLQITYMYTLIDVARVTKSLAQSFAVRNDVTEMKTYLLANAPSPCRCTNNSDLCGRCDTLDLIRFKPVSPTRIEIDRAVAEGLDPWEVLG